MVTTWSMTTAKKALIDTVLRKTPLKTSQTQDLNQATFNHRPNQDPNPQATYKSSSINIWVAFNHHKMLESLNHGAPRWMIWASVVLQAQKNNPLPANTKSSLTNIKTIRRFWVKGINHRAKIKQGLLLSLAILTTQQSIKRIDQTVERVITKVVQV